MRGPTLSLDKDKIIIAATPRHRRESLIKDNIRVRFKTFGIIDENDLSVLCLHPIKRSYDISRPEHFGMYTLGLITRSIGGFVAVCEPCTSGETIIEFVLPKEK